MFMMKETKTLEVAPEPEIPRVADSGLVQDLCGICGGQGRNNCESCDRRFCGRCEVVSELLPLSFFCSSECRDEAELAAEQARQSDLYDRWR